MKVDEYMSERLEKTEREREREREIEQDEREILMTCNIHTCSTHTHTHKHKVAEQSMFLMSGGKKKAMTGQMTRWEM